MIEIKNYLITREGEIYSVLNLKTGDEYKVDPAKPFCTCPDFTFRHAKDASDCKHLALVREAYKLPSLKVEKIIEEPMKEEILALGEEEQEQALIEAIERADEEILQAMDYDLDIYQDLPLAHYMEWESIDKTTGTRVRHERVVLTAVGYFEAARLQGNISVGKPEFAKVDGKIQARVKAIDLKANHSEVGISTCYDDKIARKFELTAAKAARNAIKRLITPETKDKVLKRAKELQLIRKMPAYIYKT